MTIAVDMGRKATKTNKEVGSRGIYLPILLLSATFLGMSFLFKNIFGIYMYSTLPSQILQEKESMTNRPSRPSGQNGKAYLA